MHRACSDADADADDDVPVVVTAAFLALLESDDGLPEDEGPTVSVEKIVCCGDGVLGTVLVLKMVLSTGDWVGVTVVTVVLGGLAVVVTRLVEADAVVVETVESVDTDVETDDAVDTDVDTEVSRMGDA